MDSKYQYVIRRGIHLALLFCCILAFPFSYAQQGKTDSLFTVLKTSGADTGKVNTLNALAMEFRNNDPDTSVYFSGQALALSKNTGYKKGEAEACLWMGTAIPSRGKYDEALYYLNRSIELINA